MKHLRRTPLALVLLALASVGAAGLASPQQAVAQPVTATATPENFANPALEERARNLQRQLRCLVCQGESIDESNAPLAADLRHLVRQQIAAGQTDAQIEDYLVSRYGNFILMKPPLQPDTYILWLAPFAVLIGAAGVAIWVISRARRVPSGS
jgi:cytochrome c-type biogenesis protein CcmH